MPANSLASNPQHSTNPGAARALLLDYGGVLMRTQTRALREALDARLRLPAGSVERVVHSSEAWRQCQLGSISEAAYWAAVAEELRLPSADLPQFRADYFAADELDHEAIAQLRRIHTSGTAVALLSNESRSLPARLAQLGIADLFAPLLVSAYLGFMKPDARAFRAALALLGLPPAQVVFVDDLAANVEAAAALGIEAIQYREGMPLAEMLAAHFPTPD